MNIYNIKFVIEFIMKYILIVRFLLYVYTFFYGLRPKLQNELILI